MHKRPDMQKQGRPDCPGFCTSDKESKVSSNVKMLKNTLNCLRAAFNCTVTSLYGRNIWEVLVTSRYTSHMGVKSWRNLWWWLLLLCCSTKRRHFHIIGWLRDLQLSPQQHHFSSPKSQARNVCKLQHLDLLQKGNILTMKEQGKVLVPAIWMSLLEAKRRNIMG